MSVPYLTILPISILLWIGLVILLRSTIPNASIQLKIDTNTVSAYKSKKYHVPKFMLELYEKNKVKKHDSERPDVVRSVIPTRAGKLHEASHLLVFDLPGCEDEEVFTGAELRVLSLVDPALGGVERRLQVRVFDDAFFYHVHHVNNTWLSFDLTEAVSKILSTNGKLLKIVVSVPGDGFELSLMPVEEDLDHDYPILLLSYTSYQARRKRSVEEDYEEETNRIWDDKSVRKSRKTKNTCKRKPLYINFSEINFDLWIVQPPGYEAYQCQGKCFYPVADHLNPTKHAIVQALLHSVSPSKVSRSCCVPTLLDSISVLYIDNNGVLTYRYAYKDMVVQQCGCR